MTPYHYAVVQARDPSIGAERRNVGLVVLSPTTRRAWLSRGDIQVRAHLIGDDAAFVRGLLDVLAEEASEVAREGSAAAVHGWLRGRTRPSEDTLTLVEPAMGIAADVEAEVRRLRARYLGAAPRRRRSVAEQVRDEVLRAHGLRTSIRPQVFESGPATWRFPTVATSARGPVVINALHFDQRTPEGVLDAAFHNIGRAGEVRAWHPEVRWVTIAGGAGGARTGHAFARACALMGDAGLQVVPPDAGQVTDALRGVGLLPPGRAAAEA